MAGKFSAARSEVCVVLSGISGWCVVNERINLKKHRRKVMNYWMNSYLIRRELRFLPERVEVFLSMRVPYISARLKRLKQVEISN